jgi:hypothetical protein
MFLTKSQASFMQKHLQLTNLKKGNSSITKYFHKFTELVDTLAAINKPLFNVELTSFLLGGSSNPEYHHWYLQDQLILGALISSIE